MLRVGYHRQRWGVWDGRAGTEPVEWPCEHGEWNRCWRWLGFLGWRYGGLFLHPWHLYHVHIPLIPLIPLDILPFYLSLHLVLSLLRLKQDDQLFVSSLFFYFPRAMTLCSRLSGSFSTSSTQPSSLCRSSNKCPSSAREAMPVCCSPMPLNLSHRTIASPSLGAQSFKTCTCPSFKHIASPSHHT